MEANHIVCTLHYHAPVFLEQCKSFRYYILDLPWANRADDVAACGFGCRLRAAVETSRKPSESFLPNRLAILIAYPNNVSPMKLHTAMLDTAPGIPTSSLSRLFIRRSQPVLEVS